MDYSKLWFPFTCSQDMQDFPPRVIERGEGVYLYDSQGKRYLDAIGSWWVSVLGHCHPEINDAVKTQIDKLEHVMMAGFVSEPGLALSHALSKILPKELTRTFYSDDGSTAVEVALKIAIQYFANMSSKRSLFVGLNGGYHGDTLAAMSVGNIPSYHGLFHERYNKQIFANAPYCYRCPVGKDKITCNAECMESLEHILANKGEQIAACIFEPMVQGASGMRVYPAKVLKRIDAACKKYGILTIADEVAVGFGRTGKMFACEHAEIVPDIMCVAKGLTGGYLPLAATIVKEHVYEAFCGDFASGRELNHGHTFTGNPLAAAAACATLSIFNRLNMPVSLENKSALLQENVGGLAELDCVGDIRGIGTIAAFELVHDKKTKESFAFEKRIPFKIAQHALDHGLLIRPLGNVLYFVPAYIISDDQIASMVEQTKNSIKAIVYG